MAAGETTGAPMARRRFSEAISQFGVGLGFYASTALQCRLRRITNEGATLRPCTILIFNHKRDLDIPLAVRSFFLPPTWLLAPGRLSFAGRADLFLTGFLALRLAPLDPLSRTLYEFSLEPVLRVLHVLPVRKSGPRMVAEWIADLEAAYGPDHPLHDLIRPAWLARAGRPAPRTPRESRA